jgi:hypothetical protein
MAYGAFQHGKIAMGRETVAGTGVAASTIWRGQFASIEDARERTIVEEQVGLLINAERVYDASTMAKLAMPATPLTFEQFPHILEAGVGTVSPSGANPYTYTYAMPTGNTVNTIKTYTIEAYNAVATADYREMDYSFVEEFTMEAKAGEAWMMSANWVGHGPKTGTATVLSTLLPVEEAQLMKTKLYIDASGGAVGTTQKTGVLMGASVKVKTGLVPVPVGDGNIYFTATKFVKPEVTFSLTMELESTSHVNAERTAYEAGSVRLIQLTCDGSSASRIMLLKFAGKYDKFDGYNNSNGNTTVTMSGHAVYSSADALFWSCAITNATATLP